MPIMRAAAAIFCPALSAIYDALTAGDRPYKQSLPRDRALDILKAEAKAGKLDNNLVNVFCESRAY